MPTKERRAWALKADYSVLAIPKPGVRVRDEQAMNRVRAVGYCELCGLHCHPQVHHISSRGAGGSDIPSNLISLCVKCHGMVHQGLIKRATLKAVVDRRG